MSTLQSSGDHLTLNADGSSKNILFQADGVQKASVSSAGLFTSTTIDATVLTGNLPAVSGASLTALNATNLGSGTVPDARFPATLPAASGTNLTSLPAANLTGTLPAMAGLYGKLTIWVPSAAMTPTASNGCADRQQVETTAGRPDMDVLDFDDGSDEHAQFSVAFPKSWALGTVTYQVFWTTTASDTDGVAWALQGVACSNDGTIDVAYGTPVVVTDDNGGAAEDLMVTAESSAITIAGTPADDDLCYFRIFRDVSDCNDDMAEDARLIGIKLFYTTDANNDA